MSMFSSASLLYAEQKFYYSSLFCCLPLMLRYLEEQRYSRGTLISDLIEEREKRVSKKNFTASWNCWIKDSLTLNFFERFYNSPIFI